MQGRPAAMLGRDIAHACLSCLPGLCLARYWLDIRDIVYESPITNLCDVAPVLLLRGPIGPHFAG